MNNLLDIFTTREIAIAIWSIILVLFAFKSKSFRQTIYKVFKILVNKELIALSIFLLIYFTIIVYFLYQIGFWDKSLLKDTVIWLIFSGFILYFNLEYDSFKDIFSNIIKTNIKLIIIWGFIANYFTFSLAGELIFIPVVTLFTIIGVYVESSKTEEINRDVVNFVNILLGLIGIVLIAYVAYKLITDYKLLFSLKNLKSLLLPIILGVSTIPFSYFFNLIIKYKNLFIRLETLERHRGAEQIKEAKKEILISANLSLTKLMRIDRNLLSLKAANDIRKQIKNITKKPLHKKGFISNKAKVELFNDIDKCRNQLSKIGIGYFSEWRNNGYDFQSITPYFVLPDSYKNPSVGSSNNIAGYLIGEETYIKKLSLTLNINNINQKESVLLFFKDCINKIFTCLGINPILNVFTSIKQEKEFTVQTEQYVIHLNTSQFSSIVDWEFVIETKENKLINFANDQIGEKNYEL